MKKIIILTLASLIVAMLLWWAFNMLAVAKLAGRIEGIVVAKTNSTITIKKSDGSEAKIPDTKLRVGENVNILIYKTKLTGKTEYRYFKIKSFGVSGD